MHSYDAHTTIFSAPNFHRNAMEMHKLATQQKNHCIFSMEQKKKILTISHTFFFRSQY